MTKTTTTATAETLQRAPLAKLKLAPENSRYGSNDLGDLKGLRASIDTVGDLLDPLHTYPEGDAFMVWDGGRRLAALNLPGKLPAALAADVPMLVSANKAEAMLRSRATFVREGLDAAEEFVIYKRLLDAKHTPDMIAAACSVATPRVKQLLRLCDVSPVILKAFLDRKVALDVVEAFSISADHKKQAELWAKVKDKKSDIAWTVKRALLEGSLSADSRIAVFVGRDVYEKAGGKFLLDLFTHRDDEAWADRALAERLAKEKTTALEAKYLAEGWEWSTFVAYGNEYEATKRFGQLPKPPGGKWANDVMATAGVFVVQKYNGDIDVQRGWTSKGKAEKAAGAAPAAKKPAQSDPGRFGFSHLGHLKLTEVATAATQVALVRKPEVAYDAMLTHLAWMQFGPEYETRDGSACRLVNEQRNGHRAEVHVEGETELEGARRTFAAMLKPFSKDRVAFCEAVAGLIPEAKAELLAYCFGQSLYAAEEKSDWTKPVRWSHLGWIAAKAGVDPATAWTPDAEFLKGGSRDALLDAVKQLGGPASLKDAKKGALVAWVAEQAKEKGWTPTLLATFTDVLPKAAAAVPEAGKPFLVDIAPTEEFSAKLRALAGAGAVKPADDESDA